MRGRQWVALTGGAIIGAATARMWRFYQGRALERIASPEGLEDVGVAHAYARIAAMPQMALLRAYAIRRALTLQSEGEAADLGCGPGHLVVELARSAPRMRVTGVDLAEEMFAPGRERAAWAGVRGRVRFRQGDAAELPFADGSLDLVVSTLSLHHWQDPVAVLNEIGRVLRPGGAFLVFDLRRDLTFPLWSLIWFATHVAAPAPIRAIGEPMGSRNAAYTPTEASSLAQASQLTGWRVTTGPLWLTIEGRKAQR